MMVAELLNIVSGLLLRTWSATLFLSLFLLNTGWAQEGIFLSLRGTPIDNNGFVNVDSIDGFVNANDGLLCLTNSTDCCRGSHLNGDWYYPSGVRVGSFTERNINPTVTFFYRNRGTSVVRLNRRGIPSERGKFYCELINNNGANQTISVNILDIGPVMISPPGSVTVTTGEAINLQCSANINITIATMSDTPVLEWFRGSTLLSSPTTSNGNTYTSVLQISPASASDAGMYTCRLRGNQRTAMTAMVTVQMPMSPPTTQPPTMSTTSQSMSPTTTQASTTATPTTSSNAPATTAPATTAPPPPPVSIDVAPITFSGTTIAGGIQMLTCSVTVTGSTEQPTITWMVNGAEISSDAARTVSVTSGSDGSYSSTLTFNPLAASHSGTYTCMAALGNAMDTVLRAVNVQNPTITVSIASSVAAPVVGSMYTLTCAVTGAERLTDTMVTYTWSKNGALLSGQTMATLSFSSLTFSDTGSYTCQATVSSSLLSGPTSPVIAIPVSINPMLPTVYLSLSGVNFTNNSYVDIDDIGEGDDGAALLCVTNLIQCCRGIDTPGNGGALGVWFYPNGTDVLIQESGDDFYRNRDRSVVRLNRRNNAMFPTGLYCCEVPDASNTMQRVCANVVLEVPTTAKPTTTQSTTPTSRSSSPAGTQQGTGTNPGVIAGAIIVVILIVVVVIVALLIVVFFLWRRRSDKPYVSGSIKPRPTPPVAYAKTRNGSKITGIEKTLKPQILKFPSDTNITEGEGVYFKIKVSGEPQPTVTWYHDGEPVRADYAREIEADGSLAIPTAELKHSGVYKAVATNQHGSEEREIKLMVNEEGGASTYVAIDDMVSSRPIPIPEFGKYVAELHANSNQPFKDLYEALDTGEQGHTTTYATDVPRKNLNRFGNIVVYDDNRIVLQPLPELEDSQDYINACYVDGYSVPNKFIATQGPLPKTLVDFWHLIWQERPPTIVMVTNVKEGTRIKCQQYWPESGKKDFGPFQVTITDQQIFADYTIRTLSVSLGSGGRSHKVTQYHFTAWPDHGVPDYATPILAFHRRVKAQHHPSRGPMVIHCSAGVGRTGTFVVIDNILEQIEKEQVVDIPGAITKIRKKRMKMVQTHEQFMFIHDAILESVTCGDTQIAATNLRATLNRMKKKDPLNHRNAFEHQFQILEQVTPKPKEVICNKALQYSDRNRGDKFLPADRWRVILKGEQRDYINAVNINGYKQHKAFIIAQGPLKSTVRNFWKMIYDRKSAVIVMLSDLKEEGQEASAQYWPSSGSYKYGEYTVELMGEEPLEGFVIRDLSVTDDRTQQAHKVTQFHITCWEPGGHCSNLKCVTDVIEEITKVQIRSGNKPIVVHCSDTVTRSGTFCAIATTIERCKTEGVVDVFQVVKALRVQKPGAVPTVSQYKTIFDTVLVFLESFDTYANFQNI